MLYSLAFDCVLAGSFGKVMEVRKKDTGKIYSMKVLKKQQLVARKQVDHTITERKVLENINNPFVVSLRYIILYIVLLIPQQQQQQKSFID